MADKSQLLEMLANPQTRAYFQSLPAMKQFRYTELLPTEEAEFQQWFKALPWTQDFVSKWGEMPTLNGDYDYRGAWKAGLEPGENGHWLSVVPDTGQWLKAPNHPTAWKEIWSQQFGGDPDLPRYPVETMPLQNSRNPQGNTMKSVSNFMANPTPMGAASAGIGTAEGMWALTKLLGLNDQAGSFMGGNDQWPGGVNLFGEMLVGNGEDNPGIFGAMSEMFGRVLGGK